MSDVPAAALWMLAWVLALKQTGASALASGLIVAVATLVRPNLSPLAIVLLPLFFPMGMAKRPVYYAPLAVFLLSSGLGAVLLLTLQHQVYGSLLSASYVDAATFFELTRFEVNLKNYAGMAVDQAGWPAVALLALWIGLAVKLVGPREPRLVSSALGLAAMTFLLYAFYIPFEHWPFLRFMMPGLAPLVVLAGRGWQAEVERKHGLGKQLTVAAGVATLVLAASHRPDLWNYSWNAWRDQQRNVAMAAYLGASLPSRSAVLGFVHTGVIASQTGRDVIRLDLVEPTRLESLVSELSRHGLHVAFVLDSQIEVDEFKRRFASTPYGALDWPPRARFQGAFDTKCWYAEDARALGPPYATDVLNVVE